MLSSYLSVRPSVCHVHAGILSKRLHVGSCKQGHTIVQELVFGAKNYAKFQRGHPQQGRQIEVE